MMDVSSKSSSVHGTLFAIVVVLGADLFGFLDYCATATAHCNQQCLHVVLVDHFHQLYLHKK